MNLETLCTTRVSHKVQEPDTWVGDSDGLHHLTYGRAAVNTAERIRAQLGEVPILDLCCGVGGIAIPLAKIHPRVIAVDKRNLRLEAAARNAQTHGVADRITFWNSDVLDEDMLTRARDMGVKAVVADPDWRIADTAKWNDWPPDISKTVPPATELLRKVRDLITPDIVLYLSPVSDPLQLRGLAECEIMQCSYREKIKFLNIFYGNLRAGHTSTLLMD